jgi:hypothetical protein
MLERKVLLEFELEHNDCMRILVLCQKGKVHFLLLPKTIHRVYRIIEGSLNDLL